jgi:hypothetical protein
MSDRDRRLDRQAVDFLLSVVETPDALVTSSTLDDYFGAVAPALKANGILHGRLAGDFLTNSVFRPLEQTLAGFYATGKADFGAFKDAVVKGLAELAAKATVSFAGSAASGAVQTIGSKIGGGVVDKVIDFFKFAEGGLVTGPGHDRSDNIPALLSPGEFVLSARAVRRLGIPAIAAANDGTLSPSIGPDGIQHYGFGGFVKKITGAFKSVVKGAANAVKSLATPQGLLTLAASLAFPGLGSALAGAFLPAAGAAQAAALGFGSGVIPGITAVSSSLISRLAGGVASSFASGIFGGNLSTSAVLQLAGEAVAKRGILGAIGVGGGGEGLLGSQIQGVLPGVASSRTFDLGAVIGPAFGDLLDGITSRYGDVKHTASGVRGSVASLPGFSQGGLVRGPDTVPALLSPGEFVMRRTAVTAFGQPALEAMTATRSRRRSSRRPMIWPKRSMWPRSGSIPGGCLKPVRNAWSKFAAYGMQSSRPWTPNTSAPWRARTPGDAQRLMWRRPSRPYAICRPSSRPPLPP